MKYAPWKTLSPTYYYRYRADHMYVYADAAADASDASDD
eukprot:CAMPEP_0198716334 /NCGR_PEP_ID=MMETSP1471-20131121/37603_1 /TAXON_ID=41880 /ORGANISM="Pycnococcus provasolii, Strain RCC733" /LENGTH=38 /DNA_ID= /DNA_START= /DNA_END= /DNA_ORIENTATION=